MKQYDGYMGKVLFVDLTNRTHSLFPWTDEDRKRTLGGKVMAADILLHHIRPGMKAFDEDCLLGDILKKDERVTSRIPAEVLEEVLEPMHYTGSCGKMVDQVVAKWGNI